MLTESFDKRIENRGVEMFIIWCEEIGKGDKMQNVEDRRQEAGGRR
jgi:hypothetical protein